MFKEVTITTKKRTEFINITNHIKKFIQDHEIKDSIVYIFVPHTTAGVTINENADPAVPADMEMGLNKIAPLDDNYLHLEGNSAAHIKTLLIGTHQVIIIENGNLKLGVWQGVFFAEFDGPRTRKFFIKSMGQV